MRDRLGESRLRWRLPTLPLACVCVRHSGARVELASQGEGLRQRDDRLPTHAEARSRPGRGAVLAALLLVGVILSAADKFSGQLCWRGQATRFPSKETC